MASPQLELLRIATEPPEQALERWTRLLADTPIDDFDYDAQRFLPAVWLNLRRAAADFPDQARLRGSYRRAWITNQRLRKACARVVADLESHGISSLILKGVAFNSQLYGDHGARPASDFDLLVRPERAQQALDLLIAQGWRPDRPLPNPADRLENAVALKREGLELDLHWFLLREARTSDFDDPFWRDSVPFELEGKPAHSLSPTHHCLHLIVSASREPHNRARYLLDLHYLVARYGAAIDQRAVARMLEQRHVLGRLAGLPLADLGLAEIQMVSAPSLLDRAWTESTRYVFDGSHEWHYVVFPFLDYWLHFRGQPSPEWGLFGYLRRRLELSGPRDFLVRTWRKLGRMLRYRWR